MNTAVAAARNITGTNSLGARGVDRRRVVSIVGELAELAGNGGPG